MSTVERPDGARIHFEVFGKGFPLLLLAPGGVSSEIAFWRRSLIDPTAEFSSDFMVIAMDQRHAGMSASPAVPFSYEAAAQDQLAVLDALGVSRAHVWGGCIGCAYASRLIHDAPERVAAAVFQNPVGLDSTNSPATFYAMFQDTMQTALAGGMAAVVAQARREPLFQANNAAGPFSQRIHDDPAFRAEMMAMVPTQYVELIERFQAGIWPTSSAYFSVPEEWMRNCPAPLLVLPGQDSFHPAGIGERICREAPKARCLPVGSGRAQETRMRTITTIRSWLKDNTPS